MTEDEMIGWHHWLDGFESEWTPGDGDGQGGLACCDSWGRKESDTTEWLNRTELNWIAERQHDSNVFVLLTLSCLGLSIAWGLTSPQLGEGNGNPLQCSCLENPVDRGAWRAAVHRVTQSRTWLKWLSLHGALEKEMATHSSILAWRIPGTEEPGRLLSMGSHRAGHDWDDLAAAAAAAAFTWTKD